MCELWVHLERPHEFITCLAFTKFGFLLALIFGVSVSEVFRMVSLVLFCISETNGEPPVSREKLIETAIIFLDWLKQVFRGLPPLCFFSYLKLLPSF